MRFVTVLFSQSHRSLRSGDAHDHHIRGGSGTADGTCVWCRRRALDNGRNAAQGPGYLASRAQWCRPEMVRTSWRHLHERVHDASEWV